MVNSRTKMRQIDFADSKDPRSVEIHSNGHLIIWPHDALWRDWLTEEFSSSGRNSEFSNLLGSPHDFPFSLRAHTCYMEVRNEL